jgi:hypothetical protein
MFQKPNQAQEILEGFRSFALGGLFQSLLSCSLLYKHSGKLDGVACQKVSWKVVFTPRGLFSDFLGTKMSVKEAK